MSAIFQMLESISRKNGDSTESQIVPSESMSDSQKKMTGETFPLQFLEFCDNCHWCVTCLKEKGVSMLCPLCRTPTSRIPMTLDEVCVVESDSTRGTTLRFTRKMPFR